jgi:hypothetical protein
MTTIDVKLPKSIRDKLEMPRCVDLKIPKPRLPEIRLPTGGSIKGIADLTKGIPSDCSLNFNLVLQLAPIMASIECLVKVLALIAPLIDIIKGLKDIPDLRAILAALPKFIEAAEAVAPCLLVPTPLVMIPFIADILRLIIALLRCLIQQVKSIVNLIGGLELKITAATAQGNTALLSSLNCARENADAAMANAMVGIEPIKILLELAGPFFGIAGIDPIKIPPLAGAEDLEKVKDTLATLEELVATLQLIVDALP